MPNISLLYNYNACSYSPTYCIRRTSSRTSYASQVDGDRCEVAGGGISSLLGVAPSPGCSSGYECVQAKMNGLALNSRANGVCQKKVEVTTRGIAIFASSPLFQSPLFPRSALL